MLPSSLVAAAAAAASAVSLLAQAPAEPRILTVPGSDVLVRLASPEDSGSAVSRDGGRTWTRQRAPRHVISTRAHVFDPAEGDPSLPPQLLAASGNELFYVQFETEIIPEYRDALQRDGVEVLRHAPFESYLVRMPRSDVARVRGAGYVRAVAEMHLGYKLHESLIADVLGQSFEAGTYDLMLAAKQLDAGYVEDLVEAVGGILLGRANGGVLVTAHLEALDQLVTLASSSRVVWVEPVGEPELDINNLRVATGVNYVESQIGREFGQGISGHVVEGVYATHCEFLARPPYRTTPTAVLVNGVGGNGTGHGTNVAGVIYAAGVLPAAKGILPFGQMYFTEFGAIINSNNRYPLTQRLVDPNDVYKTVMQTASWGYPRTSQYTSRSAEMDDILSDFDLLVTQSHGNAAFNVGRPQAWAKNVIAVGAYNHFNTSNTSDDCWCATGSTGPAEDGRIGVTFAAYYDNVLTTSGSGCAYTATFGGASVATPIINGLGGAAIELWTDGSFGYPGVAWQNRFGARPHYTTGRVLMTVATRQLEPSQATRLQQGWGLPNIEDLYLNRDQILAIDELDVLTQGQSAVYAVWVPPGTPEFRASMHHAEEAALPNAIPTRHNSVDLNVYDFDGNVWRGNTGELLTASYNSPNPAVSENNDVDVHENVFLQNPTPGIYLVEVNAATITMDNHRETPAIDLDFGLAIRGIGGGRDTSGMTLDIVSNAPGQWDFTVGNLPAGWTEGYTFLSFDTSRHAGLGHFFGLIPDAATVASVGVGAGPGKLLHFTNSAGVYPSATFSWPAAVANLLSGVTVDGFVILYDGSGDVVSVSNVDRETIQ